jgi:phage-related minor tail protein
MLNLSELAFTVRTEALVDAANKVAALGKSVENLAGSFQKLEKASSDAEKTQSQNAKAAAQAAEARAKANKAAAQAAEAQAKANKALSEAESAALKTASARADAETKKAKALKATTQAVDESTESAKKSVSILERQQTILEFQANGYSKGQSSILAYAKAAGVASDEIQEIGRVLQAQRTLMGGDPFDKSLGSLRSLQNEFKSLKEVQRLYTAEIPLTRKQMENLALDKIRLIEAMKIEGKSMTDIKNAIRQLNVEYITVAGSINKMIQAENAIDAAHKDAAKAVSYLEREMQRVNFALQEQNNELNKGTANALNRFEQNLKRSGLTLDQQRVKMDEYRKSLLALEKTKGVGSTDYISRALGPQITDIFVGLATGQSPLTVMLQQGGQLRDQFALAGVAAADMGATMRTAAREMVTSVAAVAGAFKDLIVGAFIDTGKGLVNMIVQFTGLANVIEKARYQLTLFAMSDPSFGKPLLAFFAALRVAVIGFAATMAATGIGALIAMAVAIKQVISENNTLARSLALSGGSLALTHSSAMQFVETLSSMGVTTGVATEALAAMAKAGGFTRDEILMVGKAAAEMSTYAGVSVEDTVKAFAKLKDKPVEALVDIAKSTGMVSIETIKMVAELQKAGKTTEAAALAMKTYADVTKTQVQQMKDNYNGFSLFIINLGKGIKNFFSETFKVLFLATDPTKQLEDNLVKIRSRIEEVSGNLKTASKWGITTDPSLLNSLKEQERMIISQIGAQVRLNGEKEKQLQQQSEEAKNFGIVSDVMKGVNGVLDKQIEKTLSLTEYTKKYIAEKTKEGKFSKEQLANIEKAAKIEWEGLQKKSKADPQDNYFEGLMRSIRNETIKATTEQDKLTNAYTRMLQLVSDPKFLALPEQKKAEAFELLNQKHNAELATIATENLAAAEELRNKVLGKAEGLGKEYYDTLAKIQQYNKEGVYSDSEVIQLTEALYKATPAYKANIKAVEELNGLLLKYKEAAMASSQSIEKDNAALDLRMQVLGQTESQQVAITREYDRQAKLSKVNLDLELKRLQIAKDFADNPVKRREEEEQAEREAAEKRKVINREVAVAYAEDMQKEFDRIRNGITDSIVTALFEGGKAGSKKLRDLVVGALRQKVTIVVDAVVNTLLGNVIGSLLGGGGGIGGAVGGGAGGLINAGMQGYSLYSGLTSGTGILGRVGSLIGLAPSIGTGAGAAATAVNGLSALTPVSIASNSSVVAGATAGSTGGLGALATAAPYILAIVAIAASWKKLFGRELKDSGIQGQFGGKDGFEGQAYRFYKGGLFRSDKTELSPIDKALQKQLGDAFTAMKTQVTDFAKVLGLNADKLKNFTSDIKISLHGMNENDISAKIQEALATVNNEMAQEILGEWEDKTRTERRVVAGTGSGSSGRGADDFDSNPAQFEDVTVTDRVYKASKYAKEGEKAIDTLTRLATSLSAVNQVFDTLGVKLYESSLAGGDLASQLVDLFGGIDKFVQSTNFYYQNFYSATERQATAQRQLEAEFKKNGLTLPKTREEYRKLVESQDLSTEKGRKMYALLMQLAPVFAEISQSAEDIAAAAKDKLRDALESAYSALEKAVNAQKELLQQQAQTAQETVNRLKGIFDMLSKNVRELYMQVDSTAKMLASQGRAVIQQALSSGVLPDQKLLEDSIGAVRSDIESTQYATQFEQDKARLELAAELQILQEQAGAQLSTAELILKGIKDQIEYLDGLLKTAREQIDAALGITNAVMSVEDALKALTEALKPPEKGTVGKGDNSTKPSASGSTGGITWNESKPPKYSRPVGIPGGTAYIGVDAQQEARLDKYAAGYNAFSGTGDIEGLNKWIKENKLTPDDLSGLSGLYARDWSSWFEMYGIPAFANGGVFSNSVVSKPTMFNASLMGEAGPEAIMPLTNIGGRLGVAAVTSNDNSGSNALAERVADLEIALQSIAINTSKTTRLLERVTRDGESLITKDYTLA